MQWLHGKTNDNVKFLSNSRIQPMVQCYEYDGGAFGEPGCIVQPPEPTSLLSSVPHFCPRPSRSGSTPAKIARLIYCFRSISVCVCLYARTRCHELRG